MSTITLVSIIGIGLSTLAICTYYFKKLTTDSALEKSRKEASVTVERARKDADRIISKAHQDSHSLKTKIIKEAEGEIKSRHRTVAEYENRIAQKEQHLVKKDNQLSEKENAADKERQKLKSLQEKEHQIINDLSKELENIAGMKKEDAEKLLLSNIERETRQRVGKMIKDMEDQAKKVASRRSKEIITDAIQRTAVDHVAAITTSTVQLPDEDMKGRVIGKEGRNIRAFESISGVDVIIDDTPGAVILSAFDPIRRELAKMTMKKLLDDGRIHPARIEEEYEKSKKELHDTVIEHGERAADELGLEFHPKLIELMGKLHYRTSYGQNILLHSLEAAHIAGIMAAQLGVNVVLAKRGAMMHDIGKALDFEREGSHTTLGKEVCEQYGESAEVLNCIMAHHEEEPPETIEAILVMVADAISSVRPGARRESLETYIKRLEKLEGIANEFDGVEKAYAIQAGREIRVIVNPEDITDDYTHKLAVDIAKKIEAHVDYPGEVKVSVVRETRSESLAR
ncbi:ribonuclease Y [Candidatus Marinamargulisbacteria bacterium SCGC AG-343-D04]|nr:ribonuclease Y [Candidatus Marinamargulisbacteria bacterium SCGC AG-343-D04]